jgi:hypothetical protein
MTPGTPNVSRPPIPFTPDGFFVGDCSESELSPGCVCGRCNPACDKRPFLPCCGACMAGTPWAKDVTETPSEFWAGYLSRHPELVAS